ncbi:unnamed protein product [Linum tenue]|uniref:Secreted protein n=1 Tax=Linum tenue TaxID=586396 RepID=A0AAV0NHR1_9ROSI|nr:unnamed protein product [Linum tenue]
MTTKSFIMIRHAIAAAMYGTVLLTVGAYYCSHPVHPYDSFMHVARVYFNNRMQRIRLRVPRTHTRRHVIDGMLWMSSFFYSYFHIYRGKTPPRLPLD